MRLGQLTRQLEVEAKTIIKFLAEEGIELENHPNTKLAEKDTELVLEKFKKEVIPEEEPEVHPIPIPEEVVEKEIETTTATEEITPEITQQEKPEDTPSPISEEIVETPIIEEKIESEINEIQEVEEISTEEKQTEEPIKTPTETISETTTTEEEIPEVKVLDEDTVNELMEQGEIQSDIEAEAAKTEEAGIIKAKLTKLEGLNVVGKIELPSDPRREKKEAARKEQEQISAEIKNAGKTIDGVHPTRRAKEEAAKAKEALKLAEEKARKEAEAKAKRELRKQEEENKSSSKKKKKKKKKTQEKVLSPEELKKKATREKRQRQKEKANAPAPERTFLQKIWDFIK